MVSDLVEQDGELFTLKFHLKWIETGAEIAAGRAIVPVELPASQETVEHAALYLAAEDLRLAHESFRAAIEMGRPDDTNRVSKALIHAGVTAYARSFAGGVRGFRLDPTFFANTWASADEELHRYLYALRDKHVAHSVNAFERATTVGVVVTETDFRLISTNPSGVGVTMLTMVGLPNSRLNACPGHIERMISRVETRIVELAKTIHAQMRPLLVVGDQISVAPIARLPDRAKVAERRR